MSFVIEGKDGQKMRVTNRNMARALSTQYSIQADVAIELSKTFTFFDTQTPTAGANFFHLINGGTKNIIVTRLDAFAGTAETVTINSVTGSVAGGAVLAPGNRTINSGRTLQSGVVANVGATLTGLSVANSYERLNIQAGVEKRVSLIERPLILLPTQAISLSVVTGGIAVDYQLDVMEQLLEVAEVQ